MKDELQRMREAISLFFHGDISEMTRAQISTLRSGQLVHDNGEAATSMSWWGMAFPTWWNVEGARPETVKDRRGNLEVNVELVVEAGYEVEEFIDRNGLMILALGTKEDPFIRYYWAPDFLDFHYR